MERREYTPGCFPNFTKLIKKYNKCNKKIIAYTIGIFGLCFALTSVIMFWVIPPKEILFSYTLFDAKVMIPILTFCSVHMLLLHVLMIFGVYKNKSWCVLFWIITMAVYWNLHLSMSVISAVNILDSQTEDIKDENKVRTLVKKLATSLFFIQVFWLLAIVFMWYYWKKMKEINDVPNLVEYVRQRSGSLPSLAAFLQQRRHSGDTSAATA